MKNILNREHGYIVRHGDAGLPLYSRTHGLCRGAAPDKAWPGLFEFLQRQHQLIILVIRDDGLAGLVLLIIKAYLLHKIRVLSLYFRRQTLLFYLSHPNLSPPPSSSAC